MLRGIPLVIKGAGVLEQRFNMVMVWQAGDLPYSNLRHLQKGFAALDTAASVGQNVERWLGVLRESDELGNRAPAA
jgi:hypothetical protein